MFITSLATVDLIHGRDWTFEKIPNDHPVYHCYFDFDGPPPAHDCLYDGNSTPGGRVQALSYLEGIFLDGYLVVIHSNKDLSDWWLNVIGSQGVRADNTRQLQFGVNMIIYALTREGSITNRVMDRVR